MAVASTAALICDTGALLDYLVKDATDHVRFRHVIDRARTRYVPGRDGTAFELVVHPADPDQ